ncbi:SA1362 family protein [Paraliobacillus sp. X-1268]|uniref:SA1362 family protein n=1 Tax=Paraliobacillus sp. X-1268 TaxID=2213193 RepID=UPI000E3D67EC|nr:SA1362 family protein [Paraliobacillus sp. X-1268]
MFRHRFSVWIYILLGLAIIGLGSKLLTNPTGFIMNILIIAGLGALIYGAIYFFIIRKRTTDDLIKYKKAVKQSKKKYKNQQTKKASTSKAIKKNQPILKKKKQVKKTDAPHLRVIDGKKQKRKDRATF